MSEQNKTICDHEDVKEHQEMQYLRLIGDILDRGDERRDRTGVGTRAVFGVQHRWSLAADTFPLLTTKRVFWRAVVLELLWFLRGSTDARELQRDGVSIWDGNSSREFLDSRGLHHLVAGDIGAGYGFQWRNFGAKYRGCEHIYDKNEKGVDQLETIVTLLKTESHSRRILLSAWNPSALEEMALPPCHVLAQFYVDSKRRLSCQMYQRSADVGLGVPFNIASYALLTCLLAHHCGLERGGEFVHVMGDAHIYNNHADALKLQAKREPRPFPSLTIRCAPKERLEDYVFDDFVLSHYNPHQAVKMNMAV